uniref:Matrin-type domain-containing protein n=1 Tax=Fundulus heteroclitus TaxID=8078 RepID=A0A3Q2QBH1_FUNHE
MFVRRTDGVGAFQAFVQLGSVEDAEMLVKYYSMNPLIIKGRLIRLNICTKYKTLKTDGWFCVQCGSSRVVYVGQIPNVKYSDQDILKLAEPYGKIQKYFLHRLRRECFIEMEKAESAEKMAEACKGKQLKFHGKRLTIYVSRKYKQLKHGHRYPSAPKREKSRTPEKASKNAEEPAAKRQKRESESEEEEEEEEVVKAEEEEAEEEEEQQEAEQQEEEREEEHSGDISEDVKVEKNSAEELPEAPEEMKPSGQVSQRSSDPQNPEPGRLNPSSFCKMDTSTNQNGQTEAPPPADVKPSVAVLPPYDPDTPVGVEHVKMGYYCRICFLFYSNEDKAKKTHCSTQAHYDKLQVSRPRPLTGPAHSHWTEAADGSGRN